MENHASVTGWQKSFFLIQMLTTFGSRYNRYFWDIRLNFNVLFQLVLTKLNCFHFYRKLITGSSHAKSLLTVSRQASPSSFLARPSRISRAPNPLSLSLCGRRLKGKEKEVLGARETQGLASKTPFPFPFKRLPRGLCNAPVLFLFAISLSKSLSETAPTLG